MGKIPWPYYQLVEALSEVILILVAWKNIWKKCQWPGHYKDLLYPFRCLWIDSTKFKYCINQFDGTKGPSRYFLKRKNQPKSLEWGKSFGWMSWFKILLENFDPKMKNAFFLGAELKTTKNSGSDLKISFLNNAMLTIRFFHE